MIIPPVNLFLSPLPERSLRNSGKTGICEGCWQCPVKLGRENSEAGEGNRSWEASESEDIWVGTVGGMSLGHAALLTLAEHVAGRLLQSCNGWLLSVVSLPGSLVEMVEVTVVEGLLSMSVVSWVPELRWVWWSRWDPELRWDPALRWDPVLRWVVWSRYAELVDRDSDFCNTKQTSNGSWCIGIKG